MAAENGYHDQKGFQLYDTTGTTEDWSYTATGGYGYTFEIGCRVPLPDDCQSGNFHPAYARTVAEYEGTTDRSDTPGRDGGGNREAYYKALENTADAAHHSVIEGQALPGTKLRLTKKFKTQTSPVQNAAGVEGPVQEFDDSLETEYDVGGSGRFEWHVNPSTRPLLSVDKGHVASGPPSDPPPGFSGTLVSGTACADRDAPTPACGNLHPLTIPTATDRDNDKANITIQWGLPASDWDLYVYRDPDGDGVGNGAAVASSASPPPGTSESTTISNLQRGEEYVIQVVNYQALDNYTGSVQFEGPPPFVPAQRESWTLTCEGANGVIGSVPVVVDRGQRVTANPCSASSAGGGQPAGPGAGSPLRFGVSLAGKKGLSNGGRGTRSLFLRNGRSARVTFENPNDFPIAIDYRWSAKTLKVKAARTTVLRKRFTIPARSKRTVTLRLTRKGAKALKRARKLTVRQSIVVTGGGQRAVKRGTLTLKVKKKR